ncbi:GNAT family N-acetyltransferase [Mycoplasmopsis alligatoris]|uniref:Acetyltransferase, GNAT family n=1 Tax=Mycoplasmopsis alligatoris A21JP2 TaxID=747682 RepID=D4XW59_9BACT|nr:GNAT family N-acetyltransferase [Mycoplasmopsis alligatoris]EFF41432.1 acetyltransferase, GNAT family [Mycoplasmopsis alligatoris A21JP2]
MKKAEQKDIERILQKANEKPLNNFFIIGDIELYWKKGHKDTFVYFSEQDNKINSIYLVYFKTLLIYTTSELNYQDLFKLNSLHEIVNVLCLDDYTQGQFKNYLDFSKTKYYLKTEEALAFNYKNFTRENFQSKPLLVEDVAAFLESKKQINEFKMLGNSSDDDLKNYTEKLKNNTFISYVIKKDNKIIASASSDSWSDKVACITGVFCLEEYRKNKYASDCLKNLVYHIVNNKKLTPLLFTDSPIAKQMYLNLGFELLDKLYLYVMNPKSK